MTDRRTLRAKVIVCSPPKGLAGGYQATLYRQIAGVRGNPSLTSEGHRTAVGNDTTPTPLPSGSKEDAMDTTETKTAATGAGSAYVEIPDTWLRCAVCGITSDRLAYARNTCSQDCARTAAIVEAINGPRHAAMPTWRLQDGSVPPSYSVDDDSNCHRIDSV